MGLDVIYGDTDSIMINTNSRDMEQTMALGKKVRKITNTFIFCYYFIIFLSFIIFIFWNVISSICRLKMKSTSCTDCLNWTLTESSNQCCYWRKKNMPHWNWNNYPMEVWGARKSWKVWTLCEEIGANWLKTLECKNNVMNKFFALFDLFNSFQLFHIRNFKWSVEGANCWKYSQSLDFVISTSKRWRDPLGQIWNSQGMSLVEQNEQALTLYWL